MPYEIRIMKIAENDDDESTIDSVMHATSERRAEKIEGGILINLNHAEYYTEIVEVES